MDSDRYEKAETPHRYTHKLSLLGALRLSDCKGVDLSPKGQKARAILGIVAISPQGMRGRRWLQARLWSDRGEKEGAASLRQCLAEIRRALGADETLLLADKRSVRLDLGRICVDVRHLDETPADIYRRLAELPSFLEDLDIQDAEFEEWIRDQRLYWEERLRDKVQANAEASSGAVALSGFGDATGVGSAKSIRMGTPVIAVMPFTVAKGDTEEAYLVEGVAQELIEQLSRIRWLATIARSSSFALSMADRSTPRAFGTSLGASYVVQGAFRREDSQASLRVELTRTESSIHVWSRSFQIDGSTTGAPVARIAAEIAGNLGSSISVAEELRAKLLSSDQAQTNELIWRGRWHLNRQRREDSYKAEAFFRNALELEPSNAEAHVQLAWCLLWRAWASRGSPNDIRAGRDLGQEAIFLDPTDARGYWIVGTAVSWLRNADFGRSYIREAIALCPSMALAHAQLGSSFILSGQPERALAPLDMAMKLSPHDQQMFYFQGEQAMAHWMLEDFEVAVALSDLSILRRPSYWYAHMVKYLSLLALRQEDRAASARRALFAARPNLDITDIEWLPFVDRAMNEYFADSLSIDKGRNLPKYIKKFAEN